MPIILEGWDNIQKEILHVNLTAEQANQLEKHYIKKFNSITNGYNRTAGGGNNKTTINISQEEEELQNSLPYPALLPPSAPFTPGSSFHGISQARILEWVAIASPGDLPDPGIKPTPPALAGRFFPTEPPLGGPPQCYYYLSLLFTPLCKLSISQFKNENRC